MPRALLLFLVLGAMPAGCFGAGPVNEVYVRNSGGRAWLLRAPVPDSDGLYFVSRVDPGADGVGSRWAKEPTAGAQIEVLDLDCQPIASFRPVDSRPYSVPEAPGLEISITPWGSNMGRWNTPEIIGLEECGGVMLH
jgi:hypothetical protein